MAILICPNCKTEIKKYSIQAKTMKCGHCLHELTIKDSLVSNLSKDHKANISMQGISIHKNQDKIELVLIWKDFSNWKFNLLWGVLISLWMGLFIFLFIGQSLIAGLIMGIFFLVGLYLAYTGLFQMLNQSKISISRKEFSISHLYKNKEIKYFRSIPTKDINQIYVNRKDVGSSGEKKYYNYQIFLKTNTGVHHLLVNQIKESNIAYTIETTIEQFLKIKDEIQLNEFHPNKRERLSTQNVRIKTAQHLAEFRREDAFFDQGTTLKVKPIFKTQCPKCQELIPMKDINLEQELVFCPQCQESFSLLDATKLIQDKSHKQFSDTPEGIKVFSDNANLSISMKVKSIGAIIFLIFGLAFFLAFLFSFQQANFLIALFLITLVIFYFAAIQFIKKHTIRITSLYLWVDKFPTYYFGTKSTNYRHEGIKQLFVHRKIVKSDNGSTITYQLILLDKDNKEHILINNYKNPKNLFFAEQKIESFLNIKDEYVQGEYEPNSKSTPQNLSEIISLARQAWENKSK